MDAAVAIGGSGTGRTAIEPLDEPAHETVDNTPMESESEATVRRVKQYLLICATLISPFSP
ncbi:MAG TPA: hypothetical protein VM033_01575 [Gemmatimonadaceae bacterium]|nr:hypothetical protein [Gemmatimonadaceae bacterium]